MSSATSSRTRPQGQGAPGAAPATESAAPRGGAALPPGYLQYYGIRSDGGGEGGAAPAPGGPQPQRRGLFGKVREWLGLEDKGNDFTGHIDIPKDDAKKPEQTQQYSELGLPMTADAWAMQNRIDGGKLERMYNETLLGSFEQSGILKRLLDNGTLKPGTVPKNWKDLDGEQFSAVVDAVKKQVGSGRAFLDKLKPAERQALQEKVLHSYMDLAKRDEHAAFILELMPTDTNGSMLGEMGTAAKDGLLHGHGPDTFRVGQTVGKIRQGVANMAGTMKERGDNVYALPVPYANVRSNIVARNGVPTDGADNMHRYLEHLGPNMKTMATGYSQGGAALMDYIDRYGDRDGLDQAVALAPMGGADRKGGDGLWTGERNGVSTLSIMNQQDPAKEIHGKNFFELLGPMLNFVKDPPKQRGDGALHSGFFGDGKHALPDGVSAQDAMAAGTFGYPTHRVMPEFEALLSGAYKDKKYGRDGDWNYDLRKEPPWGKK